MTWNFGADAGFVKVANAGTEPNRLPTIRPGDESRSSRTYPVQWQNRVEIDLKFDLLADTSGVVSIAVDGTYANNAGNLTMTAAGTATSTLALQKTSPYSLNCSGYMGSTTGYGTYTITFSVWGTTDSGTWTIVRQ